ncbi:hypothetical protein ACFOWB_20655 [Chenggangzhangella methanolivorans]
MFLLLADRDQGLVADLTMLLSPRSIQVACSSLEACDHMSNHVFTIMALDELTLGMAGLRALADRRADGDATPALFLRAERSGVSELIEALVAGVTDCVRKPVRAEHVAAKLLDLATSRPRSPRS